jgi:tRNA U34 5-methylaminomethyl-2-thiouridine-forming methyltransferase MnmC
MKIIRTHDGTNTLFNSVLDEHYHSIHGARNESQHVFIEMGIDALPSTKNVINVFEMGFGTGLNALLCLHWAVQNEQNVCYNTIELNPISIDIVKQLNFSELEGMSYLKDKFMDIHECNWEEKHSINSFFTITKNKLKLENVTIEQDADVIFFDAFSPDKQPELWTVEIFKNMKYLLKPKGYLVTYCAKGYVRRNMIQAGFSIERLPGPPGKREMIRASLIER